VPTTHVARLAAAVIDEPDMSGAFIQSLLDYLENSASLAWFFTVCPLSIRQGYGLYQQAPGQFSKVPNTGYQGVIHSLIPGLFHGYPQGHQQDFYRNIAW
jgi:hypothetical protein